MTTVPRLSGLRARPLFLTAIVMCAAATLASVIQDAYALRNGGWDSSLRIWMLDIDVERSFPTWLSILMLATASYLLFDIWRHRETAGRVPWIWLALSAAFLVLSFDDFANFHERLSAFLNTSLDTSGLLAFAWAAPAGILSIIGLVALWPFLTSLPRRTALLMVIAAAAFVSGAAGMEMVGGMLAQRYGVFSLIYRVAATIEEALEQIGLLLFIYTLIRYREDAKGAAAG